MNDAINLLVAVCSFGLIGIYVHVITQTDKGKLRINQKLDAAKIFILFVIGLKAVSILIDMDSAFFAYGERIIECVYFVITWLRIMKLKRGI